jgi:tRNA threonylcarbamoyladenosine biosynthesis protein TsaE
MNILSKKFDLSRVYDLVQNDLLPILKNNSILLFIGPLGAGKTTLIKELLNAYNVNELITSPTFNYVNVYKAKNGEKIYHFDLYRLSSLDEFLDMGFDEYFYEDALILVEWPQIIEKFIFSDERLRKRSLLFNLNYSDSLDFRELKVKLG